MRNMRIGLSLLVCLILLGAWNKVFAEERSIYIGDLITIEVNTKVMGEEELRKIFEAFEVVELHETKVGFSVTLRTFEPGEKKVVIGNQEISISVKSTLKEINREDIFEGDLTPRSGHMPIKWFVIYGVVIAIFVISGILCFANQLKKRQAKVRTPYEKFVAALEKVLTSTDFSLVEMTVILKNYIEEFFDRRIIGKTSDEMMLEIDLIPETSPHRDAIKNWLKVCDAYKFSGSLVNKEEKDQLLHDLKKLGSVIHEPNEVKV